MTKNRKEEAKGNQLNQRRVENDILGVFKFFLFFYLYFDYDFINYIYTYIENTTLK